MGITKVNLTYNELHNIYKKIKKYPKEMRAKFFEESIRLNGYNIFESFVEADEQERNELNRELQKGYMKLLSN